MQKEYPFNDIVSHIGRAEKVVQSLRESPIKDTPAAPFLDNTLVHLESARRASVDAALYSHMKSVPNTETEKETPDKRLYGEIFTLLLVTKRRLLLLKDSPDYQTAGGPFLDETLQHIEAAAASSSKAAVYSLPQSSIDSLPD